MKGIYRIDVDVILEKYYAVGCKYKAATLYLKKNQNAPRPSSEHTLVKAKQRQCSTPSSMVL